MATYKGIQGYTVQKLSTDPTASEAGGQLWYNSTSGAFKLGTQGAGAWASGGVLSSPRGEGTGAGTQTAGIAMGGRLVPGSGATVVDVTETYNGTSWTEVNNLTSARRSLSSAKQGTTTASLVFGGDATGSPTFRDLTESYNGTSWSEGGDLTLEIESGAGAGTQTAALSFGGGTNPEPTLTTNMQSWDGTSWTDGNSLNTGRNRLGGTGTTSTGTGYLTADATVYIAKGINVPAGSSLVLLSSPIYLMEADILSGGTDNASDLDLFISYEVLDDA